jgi:hypothetical protein
MAAKVDPDERERAPLGKLLLMTAIIKLTCRGTAKISHPVRTVAQFRYDDGWARVHDRVKRDEVVQEPDGELSMNHLIACDHPACTRAESRLIPSGRLYPALDYARDHGNTELPLR